jgi:initiation factor 1A
MVINKSGGNKTKKISRSVSTKFLPVDKVESGQMFAQILGSQGECRFRVICSDGVTRLGKLSGYMKKGPRISSGSFVVVSLREFEQEHKNCDIISYGNPPYHIISIFKKNDVKLPNDDIEFEESDDEFKDLDQSVNRKFDLPPTFSDEENEEKENEEKDEEIENNKIVVNGKNKVKNKNKDSDEEEEEEIDWNDL